MLMGGALNLHGDRTNSWTKLSSTVNAGATSIQVLNAAGWRVGDEIVLASTVQLLGFGSLLGLGSILFSSSNHPARRRRQPPSSRPFPSDDRRPLGRRESAIPVFSSFSLVLNVRHRMI